MTQFNKGPAYGLSAEVRSKVRFEWFYSVLVSWFANVYRYESI